MKLFECTVKYNKSIENGTEKNVQETYVVNAETFTEAEARVIKLGEAFGRVDSVTAAKIAVYTDIIQGDKPENGKWYKVKINYVTVDEKNGKEKKLPLYLLTFAADIDGARRNVDAYMKGSVSDWECAMLKETKIMDVIIQ